MMKGALIALVLCAVVCVLADQTIIAERRELSSKWFHEGQADDSDIVSFRILLKQQNLDKLEKIFWDVSDPQSANYGKYLTMQQAKALVAPAPSAGKNVLSWLQRSGIPATEVTLFSDFLKVSTTVDKASKLFGTSFSIYRSLRTDVTRTRIDSAASIPTELMSDIDFVVGLSELIDETAKKPVSYPVDSDAAAANTTDQLITPDVLRAYYGIPTTRATNQSNLQAIGAFTDYFSYGALQAFDEYFNVDAVNVTIEGSNCLSEGCDQFESDLDVQYITSLGLGVPTDFIVSGEGLWVLDWAQDISNMQNAPLVNSISYGWYELDQCAITSECNSLGYDAQQYVNRSNSEMQMLGARGISIMVSAGDDGAPSFYDVSGNCPLDGSVYCPLGGCNHTSTNCPELTFTLDTNNTMCYFPMGLGSRECQVVLTDSHVNKALQKWAEKNKHCDFAFDVDRMGNYHVYSSCQCSDIKTHTEKKITIAPYTFNQNGGAIFNADWPTSSPYVTSVGATQFTWSGENVESEIVCSIETGAIITGGGGFSSFQTQPSYQTQAVSNWVQNGANIPPSFSFNPKMRAYPDVTFNGHNYLIYASNNTEQPGQCPCISLPVDGTSCSSPSFAGFISMINDKLLNAGKPALGFLNPMLYQMASANPASFNDITSGNINCNRAYCCQYGFSASKGWDPASGLGSPVFSQFESYVMSAKK